jgi:RNA polymerase sporulation-specific sigma factor
VRSSRPRNRPAAEPALPSDSREDDRLIAAARSGDEAAVERLLVKYRSYARAKARSYFIAGADTDDVVQEGMIGLFKAIRDYDPAAASSFSAFAELCISRQVITAIKAATRFKHGPLNSYVSLSCPTDDGGYDAEPERAYGDAFCDRRPSDPADLVISAERIRALQDHFDEALSDLEVEVLRLYVDGKSYQQIAAVLSRHVKSIDNALQRIKRKLDDHLRRQALAEAG